MPRLLSDDHQEGTMEATSNKKAALLYMLEILKSSSQRNSGLNQCEIAQILKDEYGITLNRETIGKNLDILLETYPDNIDFRLNNAHKRCGWQWIDAPSDDFDESEVRFILGIIECYGKLDARHKQSLIDRVAGLSPNVRSNHVNLNRDDRKRKSQTLRLFYNLGILGEAISKGYKVTFARGMYTHNGTVVRGDKNQSRQHTVSPRAVTFKNNSYMLISTYNGEYGQRIMHSCIDTMLDLDYAFDDSGALDQVDRLERLSELKKSDLQKYIDQHVYMISGKPVPIKVRVVDTPYNIRQIYDQFGLAVIGDGKCEVEGFVDFTIKEPEESMVFWAMQFSGIAEILEPEHLRIRILSAINEAADKYSHENNI